MGQVACIGELRNMYKILVGKLVGKRSLGRSRRRWETVREIVEWIRLAQDMDLWWLNN